MTDQHHIHTIQNRLHASATYTRAIRHLLRKFIESNQISIHHLSVYLFRNRFVILT